MVEHANLLPMAPAPHSTAAAEPAATDFFDFSRASARRWFALFALGSVTGLGIAGYGLLTATATSTNRLPPEDIALVNQKPIYRSDFIIQTQTQYSAPFEQTTREQRRRVLDDMINEELIVQRGIEVDLPGYDPEVRAALVKGMELQMYAEILASEPSERELRTYYEQNSGKYSNVGGMRLRDLLLNARQDETETQRAQRAQQLVAELRESAHVDDAWLKNRGLRDSGRLMQSGSTNVGDIFDFAVRADLGPRLYAVVSRLQTGQVSDPVSDSDGIHIVLMNERKAPQAVDYETARSKVWTDLKNDAQDKVRNATLEDLRSKADILVTSSY